MSIDIVEITEIYEENLRDYDFEDLSIGEVKEQFETTIETLLIEKRQIIFYGPPGTSKTYVARKFSAYFTQDIDNVEIIQFHPSYSYEDFVEGIKPVISKNGASGFSKEPGLVKKLAKRCIEVP